MNTKTERKAQALADLASGKLTYQEFQQLGQRLVNGDAVAIIRGDTVTWESTSGQRGTGSRADLEALARVHFRTFSVKIVNHEQT